MRKYGYIPDRQSVVAEDLRTRHIGQLFGASQPFVPASMDWSACLDRVQDQGNANACVGFSLSTAIYMNGRTHGVVVRRPSPKAIYDVARLIDSPDVLVDKGCMPNSAMLGVSKYGLVAEKDWSLVDHDVNELPPLDVFERGIDSILTGWYRIGSGDICAQLRSAIALGHFPIFGMAVDEAYESWEGGVYERTYRNVIGRHMQVLVGYRPGAFMVCNSWGDGWSEGGFAWLADAWMASEHVSDIYVVTSVPKDID